LGDDSEYFSDLGRTALPERAAFVAAGRFRAGAFGPDP